MLYILVAYIIKSSLAAGLLYAYYLLALRNKKFHGFNRFYLLATVVFSLVIPLINQRIYQIGRPGKIPLVSWIQAVSSAGTVKITSSPVTTGWMIISASLLISFFMLKAMFAKIAWIYRVKKAGRKTRKDGFTFIETDTRQAPFSFLDNLFWRTGMAPDDANGIKIFTHELTHIRQRHTHDKLFVQTIICLFWMNPVYWIIRKELNTLHEFMADAAAIDEGDAESFAAMLLQAHNGGQYLSLSNSFFHPSIKRRLFMITTSGKTSYAFARRVTAPVVAILVFGLFSATLKAQQTSQAVDHIEIHGQTGIGDTAIVYFKNGAKERFFLNNPAENKAFKQKYEALLPYHPNPPAPKKAEQTPPAALAGIEYLPLNPIPATISQITFGSSTIWLTLSTGVKEQYDLNNADEKKSFESKYGKLKVAQHS